MKCLNPECGFDNASAGRFCKMCGTVLASSSPELKASESLIEKNCPSCHSVVPWHAKFCAKCGFRFAADNSAKVTDDQTVAQNPPLSESDSDVRTESASVATKEIDDPPIPAATQSDGTPGKQNTKLITIGIGLLVIGAGAWLVSQKTPTASVPNPTISAKSDPVPSAPTPFVAASPPPETPTTSPALSAAQIPETPAPRQVLSEPSPVHNNEPRRKESNTKPERVHREKSPPNSAELKSSPKVAEASQKTSPEGTTPDGLALAPNVKKPNSPRELCADRPNFISRDLCESRACKSPEWINHPYCINLRDREERNRDRFMGNGS
jgi:hypothetical protein